MKPEDRGVPSIFVIPLAQVILGLLLFVALIHGERDLILWALLVLGLAAGAKLWAGISLSGIRCHSSVDKQRAFPGEKLTLRISAENHKFLPVWLQVNVPVGSLLHPSPSEGTLNEGNPPLMVSKGTFRVGINRSPERGSSNWAVPTSWRVTSLLSSPRKRNQKSLIRSSSIHDWSH